jgi:hypothetical protein
MQWKIILPSMWRRLMTEDVTDICCVCVMMLYYDTMVLSCLNCDDRFVDL